MTDSAGQVSLLRSVETGDLSVPRIRIWLSSASRLFSCSTTYYYRKKRFWWHNVKRLQGHLTDTKHNSTSATQQNEQSILSDRIQTAAELSESGKLRANSSIFS